ncbi:RNA ligase family protein [Salmonella enterica]|nr:RNA ligase family protein [Salmonella enterica]
MNTQRKYGRTWHYPFSPGTTSDDRINADYWRDIQGIPQLVHTEKLDGENNCLNRHGVFARSHAAPTQSAWTHKIRQRWQLLKNDLGDLELFGENLYAVHSIEYRALDHDFFLFAIRCNDMWLGWEEVQFYAALFDFPCVPEIAGPQPYNDEKAWRSDFLTLTDRRGAFDPWDTQLGHPCTLEGIVSRNRNEFPVNDFAHQVFKFVRKNHVKTTEHWKRNWRRARMGYEFGSGERS